MKRHIPPLYFGTNIIEVDDVNKDNMKHDTHVVITDGGFNIHTEFDESEGLTEAITQALTLVKGTPMIKLDPLYESIDPELLSQLLQHANKHNSPMGIEFSYEGLVIVIREDGSIQIHDGPPKIARMNEINN